MRGRLGWFLLLSLGLGACEKPKFTKSMTLGGVKVSAARLNHGREAYMHYCYACHGERGDGYGPAAPGLRPPPRNFTLGKFKFAAVSSGQLPHDEDFIRIVRGGLHGTAMLQWDIPDRELKNIIHYIKTFSPRWQKEVPGDAIVPAADPFGPGRRQEAEARGKKVYHGLAQCWSCHPAYSTRKEISEASLELRKVETTDFREHMYDSALKESDYKDEHFSGLILPPDFTRHKIRSVRKDLKNPQIELQDLYRVIAAGIGGTAMPQWKGALPEPDIWAMAYYVRSLTDIRDNNTAIAALRKAFADQPPAPPPVETE